MEDGGERGGTLDELEGGSIFFYTCIQMCVSSIFIFLLLLVPRRANLDDPQVLFRNARRPFIYFFFFCPSSFSFCFFFFYYIHLISFSWPSRRVSFSNCSPIGLCDVFIITPLRLFFLFLVLLVDVGGKVVFNRFFLFFFSFE